MTDKKQKISEPDLLRYVFEQSTDMYLLSDSQSRFVYANPTTIQLFGFTKQEDLLGLNAHDMRCPAADSADAFLSQDRNVIDKQNELSLLDIHTYADGEPYILLTRKSPIFDANQQVQGVLCHCRKIANTTLQKISTHIVNSERRFNPEQSSHSYNITQHHETLSKRELECLFFLLRGKTMAQIAEILFLSNRTVENHIANIKAKLGCNKKSQLIEYGLQQGYLSLIPASLLRRDLSIALD